jgi:signal transduction histidine kinase
MLLTRKFALAFFAAVLAVLSVFTALRVRREVSLFDSDIRRDHRIIGITAAAAIARARSADDAAATIRAIDRSRENISIEYVSLTASPGSELAPVASDLAVSEPAGRAWHHHTLDLSSQGGPEQALLTLVAAPVPDQAGGAIQLVESLAPRRAYVLTSVFTVLATSLTLALVFGVLAVGIGVRLVARPVAALIRAATRIGAGDPPGDLHETTRSDELGELARALIQMHQQLERARENAASAAESRIRALEQMRHADRLATLGQMASVVAHEIGTPLNVVAGHAKLIATGRAGPLGVEESAKTIGEQCDRIARIVRSILDYARRRPARTSRVDLNTIAESVYGLMLSLAQRQQVELQLRPSPQPLLLDADASLLQQALTNLVLNGIQAAGPKGTVTIGSHADAATVSLTVSDTGPGVPAELTAQVFEPFFTTKSAGEGTGLGLSIVRDVALEHAGTVDVASPPGRGALFTLRLPRAPSCTSASSS